MGTQTNNEFQRSKLRNKTYINLQLGMGAAYMLVGAVLGFINPSRYFLTGNFIPGVANTFSAIGIIVLLFGYFQYKTGKAVFQLIFKKRNRREYHYNIWLEMKPGSLRFLALAVFLIFAILGPISIFMGDPLTHVSYTLLTVSIIGSGGTAASIILFGNKPPIMIVCFLLFMGMNMFSTQISNYFDGNSSGTPKAKNQKEMIVSKEERQSLKREKVVIGISAIVMLTIGYVLFIIVIGKEGGQRLKLQAEVNVAKSIQDSLLPPKDYQSGSVHISGVMKPAAQVAGDYYDFYEPQPGCVAVTISDSSGHGVGAGIHAAMIKSALRMQLQHDTSPSGTFSALNKALYRSAGTGMFSTMAYMLIQPGNIISLATAGHPPILYYQKETNRVEHIRTPALGIGISGISKYSEVTVNCKTGDCFILFTDGLSEGSNEAKELFGIEKIAEALLKFSADSPDGICSAIVQEFDSFIGKPSPDDDVSLVCVKII